MKLTHFIFVFLVFGSKIKAQWLELGDLNSNVHYNRINSINCDIAGNVYALGNFTSTSTNFPIHTWNGNSWLELQTLTDYGYNHELMDACSDSQYLYAVGTIVDSAGKFSLARWDGNTWAYLGNPMPSVYPYLTLVCADYNGNVFVCGQSQGNTYLARYNNSGWTNLPLPAGVNSTSGVIASICADKFGNLYAAGNFTNSSGSYYVAHWNGSTWSELGGQNALGANNIIYSIHIDKYGNLYAGGAFTKNTDEIFVAKWNGSQWSSLQGISKTTPQDSRIIYDITSDQLGNVYVGGGLQSLSSGNFFIGKWNGSEWMEINTNFGLNNRPFITSLCTDPAGNLYAAGDFRNSSNNRFVAMYPNAKSVGIIDPPPQDNSFRIFPNPSYETITIQISNDILNKKITEVKLQDVFGRIILEQTNPSIDNKMDVSMLSPGLYFLSIKVSGQWRTQRIVKK